MRILCVDDEKLVLQYTVSLCKDYPGVEEVESFTRGADALKWIADQKADVALLDIDMPGMNGIELAARIKECSPDTAIIFLTGYSQYAVDAFALHATGYLLKPIAKERLHKELEYAMLRTAKTLESHIRVQTFGYFDLFVDGKGVEFNRSKAKELFAYLVDKQGSSVSRAEVFSILWEDRIYDRPMQKQLDVVVRSLKDTLKEYGALDLLELHNGLLRVKPELLDCDLYRFLKGDIDAINSYRGEYMNSYSWASLTEAYMTRNQMEQKNG